MTQKTHPDLGLPAPVVGWIHNHAAKNFWRVAEWYELDDLISDGMMLAYKCRERYGEPGVDLDPPHFMALVKSSFHNHIGDMLRRSRGVDDSTKIADLEAGRSEADIVDHLGCDAGSQDLAMLVHDLPDYLRRVVEFYLSDDPRRLWSALRSRLGGANESLSERLHKLTGFPEDLDFETELRSFLWERERGLV